MYVTEKMYRQAIEIVEGQRPNTAASDQGQLMNMPSPQSNAAHEVIRAYSEQARIERLLSGEPAPPV